MAFICCLFLRILAGVGFTLPPRVAPVFLRLPDLDVPSLGLPAVALLAVDNLSRSASSLIGPLIPVFLFP